ncbi:hypothetical protein [Parafrankia discariae]|nr:hypothetical protein [Parafrankia discariae]
MTDGGRALLVDTARDVALTRGLLGAFGNVSIVSRWKLVGPVLA